MDTVSSGLSNYVEQISKVGGELGPMVVKGMILLIIVLILVKYLGRFLAAILIRTGLPVRSTRINSEIWLLELPLCATGISSI